MIGLTVPAAAVATPEQQPSTLTPAPWEELPPEPQSLYVAEFPASPTPRDAFGVETVSPLEIAVAARTGVLEVWPSNAPVNDGYGWRDGGEFHNGIDIMADYGSPIVAASAGVVTTVTEDNGWGQYVKIDHGNGVATLYAHMISGSPTVVEGQTVSAGQVIGSVGDTGYVTFFHLHFEVYVDGSRVDPYSWLP
ncbi:MAG: M23 family metallopeptidase [Salinibacterium sp.]|nr:M23 family metallopeptidase [Salinibacterium sp.]